MIIFKGRWRGSGCGWVWVWKSFFFFLMVGRAATLFQGVNSVPDSWFLVLLEVIGCYGVIHALAPTHPPTHEPRVLPVTFWHPEAVKLDGLVSSCGRVLPLRRVLAWKWYTRRLYVHWSRIHLTFNLGLHYTNILCGFLVRLTYFWL